MAVGTLRIEISEERDSDVLFFFAKQSQSSFRRSWTICVIRVHNISSIHNKPRQFIPRKRLTTNRHWLILRPLPLGRWLGLGFRWRSSTIISLCTNPRILWDVVKISWKRLSHELIWVWWLLIEVHLHLSFEKSAIAIGMGSRLMHHSYVRSLRFVGITQFCGHHRVGLSCFQSGGARMLLNISPRLQ